MSEFNSASPNPEKYAEELRFWTAERQMYLRWYNGGFASKEMYGVKCPAEVEKIRRHADPLDNALETWVNADRWRYCKHLWIEPTYWSGKLVLEVGCGPLGLSRFFAGASVRGVDPLMRSYSLAGYPRLIIADEWRCEDMRFHDESFDAAFSVNAIDHVDDFQSAVREMERVVKPDGEIRIEVHYHAPTTTEPHVLNDEIVRSAFSKFEMKKLKESPSHLFYPRGTHPATDRFALWSNVEYTYPAVEVLK